MVHVEKSMDIMSKAERNAMPVMMPGRAMGKTNSSEIAFRPKNLARAKAAAAAKPTWRRARARIPPVSMPPLMRCAPR